MNLNKIEILFTLLFYVYEFICGSSIYLFIHKASSIELIQIIYTGVYICMCVCVCVYDLYII